MTKNSINTLIDFVNSAERSRKYPPNTANAIKNALRLFEAELNEEEGASIDTFAGHLEQIYHGVFEKNKNRMSVGSLATYKTRINKVLADYRNYGSDPTKFNSWSPVIKARTLRKKAPTTPPVSSVGEDDSKVGSASNSSLAHPRTLPSGIVVIFPKNMDAQVSFGEFGEELRKLNEKGLRFAGEIGDGDETER